MIQIPAKPWLPHFPRLYLYVEWNDDFTELCELGPVALSKDIDEKYKLSNNILTQKVGLPRFARNDSIFFYETPSFPMNRRKGLSMT